MVAVSSYQYANRKVGLPANWGRLRCGPPRNLATELMRPEKIAKRQKNSQDRAFPGEDPRKHPPSLGNRTMSTAPPQPHQAIALTDEERISAMLAYLSGLIGYVVPIPLVNLVGPCAFYFIYRDESKYIAFHALQAIYMHLLALCVFTGLVLGTIFTLGIGYIIAKPLFTVLWFAVVVTTIVLAVKAFKGERHALWLIGRWAEARLDL